MLSIVICSRDVELYNLVLENILNTIGEIPFEVIKIDNKILNLDIAEAYNNGLGKAKFPFLLFIHEDIKFRTRNWGTLLMQIFASNVNLGLLGLAGSKIKTRTPTSWWESEPETWVINLIQHYPTGEFQKIQRGFNNGLEEVVVIDGAFIAMRKVEGIKFDERLKGFHNYDQSISLIFRSFGYKIFVTKEILIEHFSIGRKGEDLYASNVALQHLYKEHLPQSINGKITRRQKAFAHLRMFRNLRDNTFFTAYLNLFKYFYYRPFSRENKMIIKDCLGI